MGTHAFSIEEVSPERVRIRHVIDMETKGAGRFTWCFVVLWLHDALIEDVSIVSDADWEVGVPVFSLEDYSGVADLLWSRCERD